MEVVVQGDVELSSRSWRASRTRFCTSCGTPSTTGLSPQSGRGRQAGVRVTVSAALRG
ncbi:MAG: hypothetical protein WKF75_00270 [Singulisphaera sp.]